MAIFARKIRLYLDEVEDSSVNKVQTRSTTEEIYHANTVAEAAKHKQVLWLNTLRTHLDNLATCYPAGTPDQFKMTAMRQARPGSS